MSENGNEILEEVAPVATPTSRNGSFSSHEVIRASPSFNSMIVDPELSELLVRKQPKFAPQAPKCAKCEKSVYKAEEIRAANKTFHKLCFKCTQCNKLLETNNLTEHQGDLFCRTCYGKRFGPKGYGYGGGAGTLSTDAGPITPVNANTNNGENNNNNSAESSNTNESQLLRTTNTSTLRSTFSTLNNNGDSNGSASYYTPVSNSEKRGSVNTMIFGGSDKCARCQKAVYAAEKVVAAGKPFHKLCFTCFTCKKMLSSINCCDNSDGEIFCKACYGKQYGPKGVGYGVGAGTLQTN